MDRLMYKGLVHLAHASDTYFFFFTIVLRTQTNLGERCPERLSNSQAVSLIQHVLVTLVLRLIMNDGFRFDLANRVFRVLPGFMGKSLVIAVKSSTKRNNKTRSCT